MFLRPTGSIIPTPLPFEIEGGTVYGKGRKGHRSQPSMNPLGLAALSMLVILLVVMVPLLLMLGPSHSRRDVASVTPKGRAKGANLYRGKQYWKDGVTLSVETIYETRFARFQKHKIQLPPPNKIDENSSESRSGTIIDDWLWFDEPDNVNVLVEDQDGAFYVLEQTKYGIPDPVTYATVGGLIEASDASPLEAAQREVREELHLESSSWISLGSYVGAANRGGGTTHAFWARQAKRIPANNQGSNVVGDADLEAQNLLKLSKDDLLQALLGGKFREIKWTATVALALLNAENT